MHKVFFLLVIVGILSPVVCAVSNKASSPVPCLTGKQRNCSDEDVCYTKWLFVEGLVVESYGCSSELSPFDQQMCTGDLIPLDGYQSTPLVKNDGDSSTLTHEHHKCLETKGQSKLCCCAPDLSGKSDGKPKCNEKFLYENEKMLVNETKYTILFSLTPIVMVTAAFIFLLERSTQKHPSEVPKENEESLKKLDIMFFISCFATLLVICGTFFWPLNYNCFKDHPNGEFVSQAQFIFSLYTGHFMIVSSVFSGSVFILMILECYRVAASILHKSLDRTNFAFIFLSISVALLCSMSFYFIHTIYLTSADSHREYCKLGAQLVQIWICWALVFFYIALAVVRELMILSMVISSEHIRAATPATTEALGTPAEKKTEGPVRVETPFPPVENNASSPKNGAPPKNESNTVSSNVEKKSDKKENKHTEKSKVESKPERQTSSNMEKTSNKSDMGVKSKKPDQKNSTHENVTV